MGFILRATIVKREEIKNITKITHSMFFCVIKMSVLACQSLMGSSSLKSTEVKKCYKFFGYSKKGYVPFLKG